MNPTESRRPRVAIVGAGISGICLGVFLRRAGFHDFTIFEKAAGFGGTWRDNSYPGLVCDVPSRYYQFTFAKNPDWTQLYSTGPQINRYLTEVAHAHRLHRHTRWHSEITAAEFDGRAWHLTTAAGARERFDFVVCATGFLHHPRLPQIPGLDDFAGPAFHSSRWDHGIDLRGKRIGVIGTGSTGTQLVRALAGRVPRVVLFQRSAQWVLPTVNRPYTRLSRALYRRWPALSALSYRLNALTFALFSRGLVRPGPVRQVINAVCAAHLRTVRDPELRRALTPDYPPMCKRLVVSDGFYAAVQRPDVDLVTAAVDRIDPHGVVTADGRHHDLDILVLATGFDSHAYMRPMAITGTGGRTLDQVWADGPHAFEAMMLPGFPNLFMLIGPHSPVANHPLTAVAEAQSRRIVEWLRAWRDGEFTTVEPTAAATAAYNERLRAAMPGTVWAAGCHSWYLGRNGIPEVWPSSPARFDRLMRRAPVLADYALDRPAVSR
ncbi:flavin-containing monooxygenase [Nocardia wallacei]|uniref:flavin-containing monooxygenase n=1 Tax=Nocardia wallacei TaxID=480035 RepID=UPI002457AE5A|nr:NAD(P)/FAD-dependent oxidoreductase [Nocardia wallacei]